VDLVEPASHRYGVLAIGRALRAPLRGAEISLLAPEDVVIFKVLSTREKDLEDASAVIRELGDELDLAAIDSDLGLLATEIEGHEIARRWKRCRDSP
jgi:hypothetical protein